MVTDIWAHRFADDPKLLDEIEDDDFDLNDVANLFGTKDQDPDDWEELS